MTVVSRLLSLRFELKMSPGISTAVPNLMDGVKSTNGEISKKPVPVAEPSSIVPPNKMCIMTGVEEVKAIWRKVDAVCFDVDSTVIREEAIDELATFCGKGKEIQEMTLATMGGKMEFRESLTARLNIIKPTMHQVQEYIRLHPPTLSNNIKKLVHCLQRRGVTIYLVSGGFRGIIGPIALELNIPLENIFANKLKFFFNGEYAGFDENEPTSKSGGKGEVMRILLNKFGYSNLVMIGDGATDAEAAPPAHAFIGYGGNVIREGVKNKSKWYITDFQELIDELK